MTDSTIALDLTWQDLDRIVVGLAERIRVESVPDIVVGVLRGGMVPAVMIAHQLGVRSVRAAEVIHTLADGPHAAKTAEPVVTTRPVFDDLHGTDVLVVDDVIGTGDTLRTVAALVAETKPSRLREAVVVANTVNWAAANTSCSDPLEVYDLIGVLSAGWVRFPWEVR